MKKNKKIALISLTIFLLMFCAVAIAQNSNDQNTLSDEAVETINSYTLNADQYISEMNCLISKYEIDESIIRQIEQIIIDNNDMSNILIACRYLCDYYGTISDLQDLLNLKSEGYEWKEVFKSYQEKYPEFIPSSFESGYLEELMQDKKISADIIMIADRVSKKMGVSFKSIIERVESGESIQTIKASFAIINNESSLPSIQVTRETVDEYIFISGLEEEKIIEALVLAEKYQYEEENIINMFKDGIQEQEAIAIILESQYK